LAGVRGNSLPVRGRRARCGRRNGVRPFPARACWFISLRRGCRRANL